MQIKDDVKQKANNNDSLEANISNSNKELYLQVANDLNLPEDNDSDDSDGEDEYKENDSDGVAILQEVQKELDNIVEQDNGDD